VTRFVMTIEDRPSWVEVEMLTRLREEATRGARLAVTHAGAIEANPRRQ